MIKKWIHFLCIAIAALCMCSCSGISSGNTFDNFTNDFFINELSSNSLNRHYTLSNPAAYKIPSGKPSLGDMSSQARKSQKEALENSLNSLHKIKQKSLSKKQQLDYEVLDDYLSTRLSLCDYDLYEEILSPSSGIQVQLPLLLAEYKFNTVDDIKEYISLICLYDKYFEGVIDYEKARSQKGLFMNDSLCVDVLNQCDDFIKNPDNNYLITTFENRIEKAKFLSKNQKEKFIRQNHIAVCDHVIPAYKSLIQTMTNLLGTGQNDGGLCNLDKGDKFYELLVYSQTGCSESIEEINNMISSNRNDALSNMKEILTKNPKIAEACENYSWKFNNEEEMLDSLKKSIKKDFPAICECNCNIEFVDPALSQYLAPAFYITAPYDNYKDNYIYINDAREYTNIKYFTTLAHEGFPGHLYQTVMSYNYNISPFRTLIDYGGYTEGWATYVEMMAYYYAGLDDDVAAFLQNNQDLTMSLYASSDIGILYLGWNFKYMCELWYDFGITDDEAIENIMDYIISEPGNYLKYYVGYLKFKNLKATDMTSMAFHEAILKIGPAPFDIVEKYLKDYSVD